VGIDPSPGRISFRNRVKKNQRLRREFQAIDAGLRKKITPARENWQSFKKPIGRGRRCLTSIAGEKRVRKPAEKGFSGYKEGERGCEVSKGS